MIFFITMIIMFLKKKSGRREHYCFQKNAACGTVLILYDLRVGILF
jgi:hypothetical protein